MIAFISEPPERCEACGNGPCHDGTLCSGTHRRREVFGYITIGRSEIAEAMAARLAWAATAKEINEIMRHPRYQNHAPRSPKPGFRKR